jgi:alpha-amylase
MKKIYTILWMLTISVATMAQSQGWPEKYEGVMLQGFYWDSFNQSKWTVLEKQADELAQYFSLVWLPQSGNCGGTSMGYDDLYWFPGNGHYDSSFGTEAELRSLIKTFKEKGIGSIADIVVNHRKNVSNWVDFPKETYKDVTYELKSTDIVSDDDGGATKTWATQNGYSLSSNTEGISEVYGKKCEGWDGMRDLDHSSENVQTNVKAYLHMILEDLGYTGFRYDVSKGYPAKYTAMYNNDTKTEFSVGEFWDGYAPNCKKWLDATKTDGKIRSAVFDFPFRYTVRNALRGSSNDNSSNNWKVAVNYSLLNSSSVMSDANYRRYAVTFVENHDTEKRSNNEQDPIRKDTLAANAFLLAMPGTPCVFMTHWIDCKKDIKAMIDARHAAGIQNTSEYQMLQNANKCAAYSTTGSKSKLLVVLGDKTQYTPANTWIQILSGYHYAYYMDKGANIVWADVPSGTYEEAFGVKVTAVSANSGAQLVYTTNGEDPTSSSTKVNSGTTINITEDCTLKVGLLVGGVIQSIITRQYVIKPFVAHTATVYVKKTSGWNNMYFYAWANDGKDTKLNGAWPGNQVTATKEINGDTWYYKSFDINTKNYSFNIIFDKGSSNDQTVDINSISEDTYYVISDTKTNGKYTVTDVTSTVTAIEAIRTTPSVQNGVIYDLQGRKIQGEPTKKGIYIIGGKKVVIK